MEKEREGEYQIKAFGRGEKMLSINISWCRCTHNPPVSAYLEVVQTCFNALVQVCRSMK